MRVLAPSLLLLFALLAATAAAFYEGKSAVVSLTAADFDALVYGSEHTWVMEFYAPWCGHCQRLTPEYEKAAENLKGLVKVGAVNCDDDMNRPVCARFDVKGFPTLKIFPGSATTNAKRPGVFAKDAKEYQGARTARAIVDAALAELPSLSVRVVAGKTSGKAKNIDEFLAASPEQPKALLFTTKSTTTPLFKALSVDFNGRLVLGEVRDTEKDVVAKFGVAKFPTLLVVPKDAGAEAVVYDGALQHDDIAAFLARFALLPRQPPQDQGQQAKAAEPPREEFNPEVVKIETQEQFKRECLDRPIGMCLLSFMVVEPEFAESVAQHEANLDVLRAVKLAAHERGMPIRVLWLDALKEQALMTRFQLSDQVPSLLLLSPSKKVYRPFTAGFETDAVVEFLEETGKAKGRHFRYDFVPALSA